MIVQFKGVFFLTQKLLPLLADIDTEEDWNAYVQDRERS